MTSRSARRERWPTNWRFEPADRRWLGVALVVGVAVYVAYLLRYPYPAHGAGFYFEIVEQVRLHGYALPVRIPYYTAGGVPFAYPPLSFYLLAGLQDATGLGPLPIARFLPGLVTVAYLVPYYALSKALLGTARRAGVATVLLAVTPVVLTWHLAAGGVVRAPAFLFALSGLFVVVRLFQTGDRRWLPPAVVLFALTLLTHPVYAVFFGTSTVVAFAFLDRSRRGFLHGAAVAVGGVVVTAPWWFHVASIHGFAVFAAAAGTHQGLGGGVGRLSESFVRPLLSSPEWPLYALATAGAGLLASRRALFLPTWWVATGLVLDQDRFLFVAGSMAAAVFVLDVLLPAGRELVDRVGATDGPDRRRVVPLVVALVVVGAVVAVGASGAVRGRPEAVANDALPAPYADGGDLAAMAWVRGNTDPGASFVVLGDAAEWFPRVTHRTMLLSPWGAEWEGPTRFAFQKAHYDAISACGDAACVEDGLASAGVHPDYVYVPKGRYTVRRDRHEQSPGMRRSLERSDRFTVVYENDAAIVVRVEDREG